MTSLQGNFGWMGPAPVDILANNRSGAAAVVGDVFQIDYRRLAPESTPTTDTDLSTPGVSTSGMATLADPSAVNGDLGAAVYAVALQATPDDGPPIRVRLSGQCDAVRAAGDVALNDAPYGVVAAAQNFVTKTSPQNTGHATAVPIKIVFIPLTARTGAGVIEGWWDGISGFGTILHA